MTRSEPPAEVIIKYILTCGRLGPLGGGPDPIGWLIEDHAALVAETERLRASSSLGGREGGVARADDSAPHPDEPLITGNAMGDIAAERRRQVEVEGWSPEHDDEHSNGEMAMAAVCYALSSADSIISPNTALGALWPWGWEWWKPTKPRRDLVKSAALIVAEIERLDRIQP